MCLDGDEEGIPAWKNLCVWPAQKTKLGALKEGTKELRWRLSPAPFFLAPLLDARHLRHIFSASLCRTIATVDCPLGLLGALPP